MRKLFAIVDKENKVLGFTEFEDYTAEHPDERVIEINEAHELWLAENPQQYIFVPEQNSFVPVDSA